MSRETNRTYINNSLACAFVSFAPFFFLTKIMIPPLLSALWGSHPSNSEFHTTCSLQPPHRSVHSPLELPSRDWPDTGAVSSLVPPSSPFFSAASVFQILGKTKHDLVAKHARQSIENRKKKNTTFPWLSRYGLSIHARRFFVSNIDDALLISLSRATR